MCLWKLRRRLSWTPLPYPLISTFPKKYLPMLYYSGSVNHMTLLLEKNPECISDKIESNDFQHFHMLFGFFGSAGRAQTLAEWFLSSSREKSVPSWRILLKGSFVFPWTFYKCCTVYMRTSPRYEIRTLKCASIYKSLCIWESNLIIQTPCTYNGWDAISFSGMEFW